MCGIAGFLTSDPLAPDAPEILDAMIETIHHRGPDQRDQYLNNSLGLAMGHNRLSINDLEGGCQPILSRDRKLVLTTNGEFYDFKRHRSTLMAEGERFSCKSDSEIALGLYRKHGLDFVHHLRGEFAFALYDHDQRRLILVRDRFGIRPLFFHATEKSVVYGSEAKAVLMHPSVSRRLCPKAALLCVDLQFLDAADGYGIFRDDEHSPVPPEGREYYFRTLREYVLPNVHNLQNCFRQHGLEVIHVRIQSLTKDGRDRGKGHKRLRLHAAPGSAEACFLEEGAPIGDEIVINKTASGVFFATNLHYVLKNLGINPLFIVGVYTNECVETTFRDACDLGYLVTVIDDGCTTVTRELHEASLKVVKDRYCRVIKAAEAMTDIEKNVTLARRGHA